MIQDPKRAVKPGLYIGLISGTSMDGVDAALIEFEATQMSNVAALTIDYPADIATLLRDVIEAQAATSLHDLATLDVKIGRHFSDAANQLLAQSNTHADDVLAIGSHGQTLRHSPSSDPAYSVQIGDPATIAVRCGITTVADFRGLDLAYGGEGAPLVPAFHDWRFRSNSEDRVILNIGGISNISVLPADSTQPIAGYDTGPGNCLMDAWSWEQRREPFDMNGAWATTGRLSDDLLAELMEDPFIHQPPPKSTGRETYNLNFIATQLERNGFDALSPADVQATLLQFTVESIALAIERADTGTSKPGRIFTCGGGAHNGQLLGRLRKRLSSWEILSTSGAGLDPDMVEASAFAWLASMRMSNIPVVITTGRRPKSIILGALYEPTTV